MNTIFRYLITILLFAPFFCFSNVRLPSILANNMVLQRNSMVILWGWADPKERISISTSWNQGLYSMCADEEGKWLFNIETADAGGPYTITFQANNQIVLSNVLLGEVWLCSGQSNMEYSINQLGASDFADTKTQLGNSDFSKIRLCNIKHQTSDKPIDTCQASWSILSAQTGFSFSATALFYGINLFEELKIPIGLINSSWGGTPAESWTSRKSLEKEADLQYYLKSPNSVNYEACKTSVLFNGMIQPLIPYTIKGVIWYQGEANRWDADIYGKLFRTMIQNWRAAWNRSEFPFYFVQIAPYNYNQEEAHELNGYLMEAQASALKLPNTGMISTLDIGDIYNIHPKNKQEVGRRLAALALKKTYNINKGPIEGPSCSGIEKSGNKIKVKFSNASLGLVTPANKNNLKGFRIAGSDNIFKKAIAEISENFVLVSSDEVSNPESVRYAFEDTVTASLFNSQGLPAFPFRTDSLPFYYRKVKISLDPDSSGEIFMNLSCKDTTAIIHFTLDGSMPGISADQFKQRIPISSNVHIVARAYKNKLTSPAYSELKYARHLAFQNKCKLRNSFAKQYSGGNNALLNGVLGSAEFRDGNWRGFEGKDLVARIKLNKKCNVNSVSVGFLEDQPSWIFLPEEIQFQVSSNGIIWHKLNTIKINASKPNPTKTVNLFAAKSDYNNIRFVKVKAKSLKICPDWHDGKGKKAWLFSDEIIVE